jgi:HIV Tat-specific factor 1
MSVANPNDQSPAGSNTNAENTLDQLDQGPARFPSDPSEFDSDPRISFSKLDQKFILETEDGQEFEYDSALKRWIPTV